MSKLVKQHREFLQLLLNTSKDQAAALLDTVTPEQVHLLSEIAFNLLQLPLSKKGQTLINKKKTLFEFLASKKQTKEQKRKRIRKHYKYILTTLWALKQHLILLL